MFSYRDETRTLHSHMDGLSVGTAVDVRPMTAVSGAGYHSQDFGKKGDISRVKRFNIISLTKRFLLNQSICLISCMNLR